MYVWSARTLCMSARMYVKCVRYVRGVCYVCVYVTLRYECVCAWFECMYVHTYVVYFLLAYVMCVCLRGMSCMYVCIYGMYVRMYV